LSIYYLAARSPVWRNPVHETRKDPNIYLFSGLAADESIFSKLQLEAKHVKIIPWLPLESGDTLETYAARMANEINPEEPNIIIGVSFGGIIATEIAKVVSPLKTIIISSISHRKELPWYYRFAGSMKIHKILPYSILVKSYWLNELFFGVQNKEEAQLLHYNIKNAEPHYIKWVFNEVLHWRQEEKLPGLVHIHGTADRLFPFYMTDNAISIKGGGHFMVISNAFEISAILNKLIAGH
jgi:pimeloyl-ACP methyl ester carboxylesterase